MRARYGPVSAERVLGALPVVIEFCRRLDIAGIIDRAAPVRSVAYATHGQVIEALIANRLTSPAPMVHVGAWAQQFAVDHVLGLDSDVLNDDRIARALDALAAVPARCRRSSARWRRCAGWPGHAGSCWSGTRNCCPTPTSRR